MPLALGDRRQGTLRPVDVALCGGHSVGREGKEAKQKKKQPRSSRYWRESIKCRNQTALQAWSGPVRWIREREERNLAVLDPSRQETAPVFYGADEEYVEIGGGGVKRRTLTWRGADVAWGVAH